MRKIYILFVFGVLLLTGCKNSQKEAVNVADDANCTQVGITEADRSTVNDSITKFLNCMRAYQFDKAVAMLWVWDGEFVNRLSDDAARKQLQIYSQFKGVDYQLESVAFHTETNNTVRYKVVLFEKEEGDTSPNTINFVLNPIRHDGKWYLTVSDALATH